MSRRRCPDCCGGGGGSGEICCVCGHPCSIYVRGDEDRELPVPFSSSITDKGSQEVGCCIPLGPVAGGGCPLSGLVGAGANGISGVLEATGPGFGTGCGASGRQNTTEEAFVADCDSSYLRSGPRDFDFWANSGSVHAGEGYCPQVLSPSQPGAILSWDTIGPSILTAWGGSRIVRGPIVMVHHQRFFWSDPGGSGAGVAFWAFVGLGGGASVIAVTALRCKDVPCVGGETADQGTIRIAGGASITGEFECDGRLSLSGGFNTSVEIGCDIGPMGECYDTGEHISDFEFAADLDFASIMHECTEDVGRDSSSGTDDQDTVGQFFIPETFLQTSDELRAAYERLREHINTGDDGQTQVPPPGAFRRGFGDFF